MRRAPGIKRAGWNDRTTKAPRRRNGDEKDEKLAEMERQILSGNRSVLPPATIREREREREEGRSEN